MKVIGIMIKRKPFNTEDELLKELVKNEERLGEYIINLYSPSEEVDDTYLNALFGKLEDKGLITLLFADGMAYYVTITPDGFGYARQFDKMNWRKAINMFEPLLDPYRRDFLEILKQYPEDSFIPYGTELDSIIKALKMRGYLCNFDEFVNGWGVSYSYEDKNYLALEESFNQKREKANMNINFEGGYNQFNLASDNATIHATQSIGVDASKLAELIKVLNEHSKNLPPEDKRTLDESLEVIQSELTSPKPKKSFINTAIAALKAINGTAQFAAAVAMLIQFVQSIT